MSAEKTPTTIKATQILIPVVVIIAAVWGGLALLRARVTAPPAPETSAAASFTLAVGATLPPLELHPFDRSAPKKLAELPGKVFLLNFWATWCEACMIEMPSIVKLRARLKPKGFEVLAINMDEPPAESVASVVKKLGMEFPSFADEDGALAELFDLHAIPLSVIVSASGRVLFVEEGDRVWDSAESVGMIEKFIEGGGT